MEWVPILQHPALSASDQRDRLSSIDEVVTLEGDRRHFFKFIFDKTMDARATLRHYLDYHGVLYNDQRQHFVGKLNAGFAQMGVPLVGSDVVRRDDTLDVERLAEFFPEFVDILCGIPAHRDQDRLSVAGLSQ